MEYDKEKKIRGKTNNNLNVKRWNQNGIMLGPSMPYFSNMYDVRFFFINLVNFSYPHLLNTCPWCLMMTCLSYLSIPQMSYKDSIDKIHEVLILDVCFDAWA